VWDVMRGREGWGRSSDPILLPSESSMEILILDGKWSKDNCNGSCHWISERISPSREKIILQEKNFFGCGQRNRHGKVEKEEGQGPGTSILRMEWKIIFKRYGNLIIWLLLILFGWATHQQRWALVLTLLVSREWSVGCYLTARLGRGEVRRKGGEGIRRWRQRKGGREDPISIANQSFH
jgi:hypothetical protein